MARMKLEQAQTSSLEGQSLPSSRYMRTRIENSQSHFNDLKTEQLPEPVNQTSLPLVTNNILRDPKYSVRVDSSNSCGQTEQITWASIQEMTRTEINSLVSQPPPNFDCLSTTNNGQAVGSSDFFGQTHQVSNDSIGQNIELDLDTLVSQPPPLMNNHSNSASDGQIAGCSNSFEPKQQFSQKNVDQIMNMNPFRSLNHSSSNTINENQAIVTKLESQNKRMSLYHRATPLPAITKMRPKIAPRYHGLITYYLRAHSPNYTLWLNPNYPLANKGETYLAYSVLSLFMAAEHRLYEAEDIIVWTVLELLADPNDLPTKDRLDSNVKKTLPMVLRKVMYNVFPNMTMKYINALHYAYKRVLGRSFDYTADSAPPNSQQKKTGWVYSTNNPLTFEQAIKMLNMFILGKTLPKIECCDGILAFVLRGIAEFLAGITCTNKNFLNIIDIIQSVEKDLKSHYVEKSQSSTEILCKIFCPFMTPLAASRYYTIIYQLVPLGMSNFRCQMEKIKYYRFPSMYWITEAFSLNRQFPWNYIWNQYPHEGQAIFKASHLMSKDPYICFSKRCTRAPESYIKYSAWVAKYMLRKLNPNIKFGSWDEEPVCQTINHQLLAVFIDDYFARKELTRFAPIPIFYRDNGGEVEWINIEGVNMGETAGGRKGSNLENGGIINKGGIDLERCNTESVIDVDEGVDTEDVLMDIFTEGGVDTDKWVDAEEELLNILENSGVVMDEKVDAEDKLLGSLENGRVDMNEEVDVEDVQMDIFKNS
ncbi:uncharacterized protein LOC136038090 [Artemia franciscana]